ncbi:MAG: hypothetical protein EOO86_04795 [Pedobacter sp.]|nr:MAG: hypothetical protein EOO86_04795 [Pedobacter sp.]
MFCNITQTNAALYTVSVREPPYLPPTSFRFAVAHDTLVLSYTSYCKACSGLEPYSRSPCPAHKKGIHKI